MTTEQAKDAPSGANAPYKLVKSHGKWLVKNNIGETKATFPGDDAGYQKALAYQRALYVNVKGAGKRADKVKWSGNARQRIEKSDLPAQQKCKYCASQATKRIIHSEGMAYIPVCEAHVVKGKDAASDCTPGGTRDPSNIDAIREIPRARADLRERLQKAYGPSDLPKHHFVVGATDGCMSCGMPKLNPIHDDWTEGQQDAVDEAKKAKPMPMEVSAYAGGGCMVALYVDEDEGKELVDADDSEAEEINDLHVTLAYMPEKPSTPEAVDRLKAVVAAIADAHPPLDGQWGGIGKFNPSETSDGKVVTVALPDLPGLPPLRHALVTALDAAGFTVSKVHGYTPHMTLAYSDKDDATAKGKLDFDAISLVVGSQRWDFPLHTSTTEAAQEVALSIPNTIAALDAVIDQIMVLLRSTPTEDLPPYAQQAKDLLGAADLAIDGLMTFMGIPDPDGSTDLPDENDVGDPEAAAALSEEDQKAAAMEGEHIRQNKELPEAKVPHRFRAGRFTTPDGQTRCLVCGAQETPSGICNAPAPVSVTGGGELASERISEINSSIDPLIMAEVSNTIVTEREAGRMATVEDAPVTLPAVRAFLTEVNGHTLLTAPASTFKAPWEKALTPNKQFLWMQGRFVGAESANRNGAFWSNQDLEMGLPTVTHGPVNWLHEDRHVIGTIADSKLVPPSNERALAGEGNHIAALAAIWSWIYPDESYVIEQASDQQKLWYSMECISKEIACVGQGGCGQSYPYMQTIKDPSSICKHIRERSATRHFVDPTFLGGAVIVPPVRPGWGDANAQVMREAAALAEHAFDQAGHPDISAGDWELLMASVVAYAEA